MGISLSPAQLKLLGRHVDLLLRWNKSINLTSITDPEEVVEKHVLDSLALVPVLPSGSLLDAGSGGGAPRNPVGSSPAQPGAGVGRPRPDKMAVPTKDAAGDAVLKGRDTLPR